MAVSKEAFEGTKLIEAMENSMTMIENKFRREDSRGCCEGEKEQGSRI